MSLLQLPAAVLLHCIADPLLYDRDVRQLARSSQQLLDCLQAYRLKSTLSIEQALALADPASWPGARIGVVTAVEHHGDLRGVGRPPAADQLILLPPSLRRVIIHGCPIDAAGLLLPAGLTSLSLQGKSVLQHPLAAWPTLPNSLTKLSFQPCEGERWGELQLPPSLILLTLGEYKEWFASLEKLELPRSLRHLNLSLWCGRTIAQLPKLPLALESLVTDSSLAPPAPVDASSSDLTFHWPRSLRSLSLRGIDAGKFNQPFTGHLQLPASLTSLTLSVEFNQPLLGCNIPPSLTELVFPAASVFDHTLEGVRLPEGLQRLVLPSAWSRPLRDWAASCALRELAIPPNWNLPASQLRCPPALTALTFSAGFPEPRFNQPLSDLILPATLRSLSFNGVLKQPIASLNIGSLTFLDLRGCVHFCSLAGVNWPPSLTTLYLGRHFFEQLSTCDPLPFIRDLQVGSHRGPPLQLNALRWPPQLERLHFVAPRSSEPCYTLELPPTLKVLSGGRFSQQTKLPHGLLELRMASNRNRPISELPALPPTLALLQFGNMFDQPLGGLQLPQSLRELWTGASGLSFNRGSFDHPLRTLVLPVGLRVLAWTGMPRVFRDLPLELLLPSPLPPNLQRLHLKRHWEKDASVRAMQLPMSCAVTFADEA